MAEDMLRFAEPGGDVDYPIDAVARWPHARLMAALDFLVDGVDEEYEDCFINVAGTADEVNEAVDLFKKGIGEQGQTWNTQAAYVKNEFHTNMPANGQFPFGQYTIIYAMEIHAVPYPATPTTVGSSGTIGTITSALDHGTQVTGWNAVTYGIAAMEQNRWAFKRDEREEEENGKFRQLPSRKGYSGYAGAATATLFQNAAFGAGATPYRMRPKLIKNEEDFFVRLQHLSTLANPHDFRGWFRLYTLAIGGRRGRRIG
jgi:hypothetical protein